MESRSWRWFETRVLGLLTRPPIGHLKVTSEDGRTFRHQPLYATRLQQHFNRSLEGDHVS